MCREPHGARARYYSGGGANPTDGGTYATGAISIVRNRQALREFCAFIVLVAMTTGCMTPPPPLVRAPEPEESHTEVGVTYVPSLGIPQTCTRVLSIDGGGVRGILPAMILAEIERRTGRPIASHFDLIVDTSTGGLLAMGLTKPSKRAGYSPAYAAERLVAFYEKEASIIFPPRSSVWRLFRPKHDPEGIEQVLTKFFGETVLAEAVTNVQVPAYEIEEQSRFFFVSYGNASGFLMRDIARAATAAPTYLPPARIPVSTRFRSRGYLAFIDGGVFANNPTPFAVAAAPLMRGEPRSMLVVSIGTGRQSNRISFEAAWGWGLLQWANPLVDLLFNDPGIDTQLDRTLKAGGHAYFRLQPELPDAAIDLDDASPETIERLKQIAAAFIADRQSGLQAVIVRLMAERPSFCPKLAIGSDIERSR